MNSLTNSFPVAIKSRWPLLALTVIISIFPVFVKTYFITSISIITALYLVNVAGLTLAARYAGIVSLGHAAFFAFGAYVSAILTVKAGMNPWIAMVAAATFSVVFAYLFAIPFMRLRRVYLAMATLGLGEVVFLLVKDSDVTGGVMGIPDIPYLALGPVVLSEDWQRFYLIGFFVVFVIFLTENISRSRLGRTFHAIRTNEIAAQAMGINTQWELSRVFCYSALLSSLSGSLLAHFLLFISPEHFTLHFSFTVLLFAIIGGANVWGGLITAIILVGFSEAFRGLQDFSNGIYGLVLIVTLFLFPEGLAVLFPRSYKSNLDKGQESSEVHIQEFGNTQAPVQGMKEKEGKILEFKDISKYFGGTVALQKVTGAIGYNQILGIIGPNGAGKTTLLNVINGFLPPQTGQIIYQNKDVTGKKPYIIARFGLGRTFQVTNLFKGMSVLENVMVGGNASVSSGMLINGLNLPRARREEASIKKKAIQDLAFLGLLDKAHERVENLPYGDQKLIELARALAMEPNLLLLDEPASGLNAAETERLSQILKRIRNEGIGIIIVEHNMPLIMSISDLVLVLDFGHRIAFGTPEEIVQDEKVIRAYLGKETYSA